MDRVASTQTDIGVVSGPDACSTACTASPTCELWIYYEATYVTVAQQQHCFLKATLGIQFPSPSTIGGLKGCA